MEDPRKKSIVVAFEKVHTVADRVVCVKNAVPAELYRKCKWIRLTLLREGLPGLPWELAEDRHLLAADQCLLEYVLTDIKPPTPQHDGKEEEGR